MEMRKWLLLQVVMGLWGGREAIEAFGHFCAKLAKFGGREPPGVPLPLGFGGFQEADGVAVGVVEPSEGAGWDFDRAHDGLAA